MKKKQTQKALKPISLVIFKEQNHNADIQNPNKGQNGTNLTFDKNQGNRGKQMNPNQKIQQ